MASLTDPNSDLINALQKLSISKPKLVKGNTRKLPNDPEIQVTSWKMNEFKYTEVPCPFPTLARGLFTRELAVEGESAEGQDEGPKKYGIVARGYDKFFNIGEVRWNTVRLF